MNQSQNRAGRKGRTGRKKPSAKKPAVRKAAGRSFTGGNRKTARTGSSARTGRGGRAGKSSGGRPVLKLIVGFLSFMRTATRAILLKVRSSITMMSAD